MPARPRMKPAVGKSGPGMRSMQALQALVGGEVLVLEKEEQAVHHLAQVVGRDVGGHAHRDAGGAVDEQVREARWAGPSALARRSS